MIEFKSVYIQYVRDFYSLYNFNRVIENHTLFVGDFFDGTIAFMRTLAKIDKNYTGEIFIDGINLKNIGNKDLDLTYLPENPVLFKNKSVKYNISFPLKIRKINKNIINNTINSLFFEYKLDDFNKKIKKLDLSEQKIIALLRALIRKPKYLLLENFFESFNKKYLESALEILTKLKETSTIIACEKDETNLELFKDFEIIKLNSDKEKKED